MKQKIWAKTLLATYNSFETIADAIDNLVITQGISSGRNNLTTMESADKIINLIQRKKLLINLKLIVERAISLLNVQTARIIVLKYFDNIKLDVCLEILKLTRRTYFRKLDRALDEFAICLKTSGYTAQVLDSLLKNENWIKEHFNKYLHQEEKNNQLHYVDETINEKFYNPSLKGCNA